ncbi:amastin-like protein [Novymonas esmeraldas]|uniref:Amastin-like protein n=1 Tax=Novymonas esmeraldas TaxID=1808958 RepID=A0AAW0EQZ5_9TRYP
MSTVARAKKMFDDASSFSDDKDDDDEVKAPSAAAAPRAQHTDALGGSPPPATTAAAAKERVDYSDPTAFAAKSASASQPRAERSPADAGGDAYAAAHSTMVTRVDVSPPPKETPSRGAASSAQPSQPTKAVVGTPAAARSAPAGDTPYNTPATVSKRHAEREGVAAAGSPRSAAAAAAGTGKDRRRSSTAGTFDNLAHYREREEEEADNDDDEAVAFSTVAKAGDSRTVRRRSSEGAGYEMQEQYTPASANRQTAAQLDYSHDDGHPALPRLSSDDSDDEDFPFSSYIFPRLDPALADYRGSRTAVAAAKRGEAIPPNAVEQSCAYLMVTDVRVAVYLGVLLLSLVLVVVSIPTSQLDQRGMACFTYWGYKANCDSSTYTLSRPLYPCADIRSRLGAGAAFSILTLIVYLVNLTAAVIAVCCLKEAPRTISLKSRVVIGALGSVAVVTQLISWAAVAGIYSGGYCNVTNIAYGVGFGLNLSSWVLNVLGVVLLLAVPSHLVNRHQQPQQR